MCFVFIWEQTATCYIHEAAKEALGEKEVNKGRKTMFWDAEREKERQNKKLLFLKWLSTKDNNDKVQYKKIQAKIRRMVANYRNKFWDRKCLEIQTYLGNKRVQSLGNLLKIYDYPTVVRNKLI
jgi:hypothetical protein